jgi:hypothetical protein
MWINYLESFLQKVVAKVISIDYVYHDIYATKLSYNKLSGISYAYKLCVVGYNLKKIQSYCYM